MNNIQSVRGMHDILPNDSVMWRHIEQSFITTATSYGYQEIRLPILEKTELFKRTIGTETDIISKEMYSFIDQGTENLSLRPEGTAGCVRSIIEHGLYRTAQRLWYIGPYFRRERPQKGRTRQFHQAGAEVFGFSGPDIDAELILFSARLLKNLNIHTQVKLHINSLGSKIARDIYQQSLVTYFNDHCQDLDQECQERLRKNPLRLLDSKNPAIQSLISQAPKLTDFLEQESQEHLQQLMHYLDCAGLHYELNPHLVRGLDYYNNTVFEWVSDNLGAQSTICAGGRYDGLIAHLGGKPTPAMGFALGLERAILLYQQLNQPHPTHNLIDIYVISVNHANIADTLALTEQLRNQLPNLNIILHCGEGNLSNKLKKAAKNNARFALIIGNDEHNNLLITLKNLKIGTQLNFSATELMNYLSDLKQ